MWKLTRKGQLEIMGLVIIVVLIALGMLFLLKFAVLKPAGQERQAFVDEEMAVYTLSALMITETPCQDMTTLIKNCAEDQEIICQGYGSCDFIEVTVEKILSQTLKVWQRDYVFEVYFDEAEPLVKVTSPKGCPGSVEPEYRPIRTRSGLVTTKLSVCRD